MPRILGLLGATTFALALLTPTAAHADRWGAADASGDVEGFSYNPEPAPCGTSTALDTSAETNEDITRLGVRHSRRALVVTTHFADLTAESEQILDISIRASTGGYELDFYREDPGSGAWDVFADLSTEPIYPDPEDVPECGDFLVISDGIPCRIGHEIGFAADVVRLSVPRRCLGNPRWVRVGADAHHFVNHGASFDIYSDEWDGGKKLSDWLPPFGPRVRATDGAPIGGGYPHPRATGTSDRHVVSRHGAQIARR